jgi:two-component system chemotaxis sensor kinase CheA
VKDRYREIFMEEARELLGELEDGLLELEGSPLDGEAVRRVFRALHTIKGSGGMFGFERVASFTHAVEAVFDRVRNGLCPVTPELIDIALAAKDHIRELLEEEQGAESPGLRVDLVEALRRFAPETAYEPEPAHEAEGPLLEREEGERTYRIRFRPCPHIYVRGIDPLCIVDELRALGNCSVVAHLDDIPLLPELDPDLCYVTWDVILSTRQGREAIQEVFIFVEEDSEVSVETIDEEGVLASGDDYKKLGEILLERGDVSTETLEEALKEQKPLGEVLLERGAIGETHLEAALAEQTLVREKRAKRLVQESISTVRVPAEKLDKLVDLVGELVTVQARLAQAASGMGDTETVAVSEAIEGITAELHDNAMSLRMVPIGSVFGSLRRLVRDLSQNLGRRVRFETEGAETELDKTVIERLNDPLVHLIRNCIDHGMEPPGERASAGKPPEGTVRLAARHSGAFVLLEVGDDGRGIDREALREKAVEKGLLPPDASSGDEELYRLIFAPGFSTAGEVTEISGRGVGMEVVQRSIEGLRGTVDVESRPGKGTRITLKIPLTLAIIGGLLVRIGEERFVFPLSQVEECVELMEGDLTPANGRCLFNLREQVLPYIVLRGMFRVEGPAPPIQQMVVTDVDGQRVGFVVDAVIGEHQTVIKSLGKAYRAAGGVSGATILGDGRVALILDPPCLYKDAETACSVT